MKTKENLKSIFVIIFAIIAFGVFNPAVWFSILGLVTLGAFIYALSHTAFWIIATIVILSVISIIYEINEKKTTYKTIKSYL